MSDEQNQPSEIQLLKERADLMGIEYHTNIGVDKLKDRIEAHMNGENFEDANAEAEANPSVKPNPQYKPSPQEIQMMKRHQATKLVRIRLTNMNPVNANIPAVIVSVGNASVGMIKKAIPFNVPWHVPQIMLDYLRNKKFMTHYEVNDPRKPGKKIKRNRLVPEYGLEILPPLSSQELKDLQQRQAMAAGGRED